MNSRKFPLKTTLLAITAACSVLSAPVAQANMANGIVDTWKVDVNATFLTNTVQWQGFAVNVNPIPNDTSKSATQLTWGDNTLSDRSSLTLTNNVTSKNVNTGIGAWGTPVSNLSVTHANKPITGNTLDKVTLRSTLTLTPFSPSGAALPTANLDFLIDFLETPNNDATCAGGGANGASPNQNGCADIFVISQSALNFPFFYDLDGGGTLQNQPYFISFFEQTSGLNPLPAAACASVGIVGPCLGFRTPEVLNTTVTFAAMITTEPVSVNVPEPGTLAILGLGLAGLGLSRRLTRK